MVLLTPVPVSLPGSIATTVMVGERSPETVPPPLPPVEGIVPAMEPVGAGAAPPSSEEDDALVAGGGASPEDPNSVWSTSAQPASARTAANAKAVPTRDPATESEARYPLICLISGATATPRHA